MVDEAVEAAAAEATALTVALEDVAVAVEVAEEAVGMAEEATAQVVVATAQAVDTEVEAVVVVLASSVASLDTWRGTALREVEGTEAVEAAMEEAAVAVVEAEVLLEGATSAVSRAISLGSARTGVKAVVSSSASLPVGGAGVFGFCLIKSWFL